MTYSTRHIDVEFRLGKGDFGDSGFNTVTLSGLGVSATIAKSGGVSMSQLNLRVYGMTLTLMNQLSTLGKPLVSGRNNTVIVRAGSDDGGKSVVFQGTIFQAWADMQAAPETVFVVSAFTGLINALAPVPPTSFQGQADVAVIMSGLAQQMGLAFENSGVDGQLANPYFPGTARDQAAACAKAANINWLIDDATLAIWPIDAPRRGSIPLISPDSDMVNYPTWTDNGVVVRTLYNPSIVFGAQVQIDSGITPAKGVWTVFSVTHTLEADYPDAKEWFTKLEATVLGHTAIASQ
jgi:hypothetical protein